ncbi:MAG TPA: hypothetical protein VGX91_12010 [Candidatus Cybelea sp.]|jgi:hypothetical protein|nr:hypothetical protein [Candidatus Cybelea sp.]
MSKLKKTPSAAAARTFLQPTIAANEEAYRRVLDAISLKRRNPALSLSRAAKASGTTLKAIRQYAPEALEERGGRISVKPFDHLKRRMLMLTSQGLIHVTALDSDSASVIGEYWNAVRAYITSGDFGQLEPFVLRFIQVEEGFFEFLTHRPTLNRLARAGELHFQDLYASTGGV